MKCEIEILWSFFFAVLSLWRLNKRPLESDLVPITCRSFLLVTKNKKKKDVVVLRSIRSTWWMSNERPSAPATRLPAPSKTAFFIAFAPRSLSLSRGRWMPRRTVMRPLQLPSHPRFLSLCISSVVVVVAVGGPWPFFFFFFWPGSIYKELEFKLEQKNGLSRQGNQGSPLVSIYDRPPLPPPVVSYRPNCRHFFFFFFQPGTDYNVLGTESGPCISKSVAQCNLNLPGNGKW